MRHTMRNAIDHFAIDLTLPHLVAVTSEVMLETPDNSITKVVSRGIYAFTSFKTARAFATQVNADLEIPVAFRFKRYHTEDENEHD